MVETDTEAVLRKEDDLKQMLVDYGGLAIAYSGGVDSSYLADVAHEVLGDSAHMLLADSPSIPRSELAEAKALAGERGWRLAVLDTCEFEHEAFLKNDPQRCYHCKSELFTQMAQYAEQHGIDVIAYGETADDSYDTTRVGTVAAREHGAAAPLQQAGLTKTEIRQLSERRGLATWNKASFACLASRFTVGTPLEMDGLAKVEQSEETLKRLGFHQYRARHHGDLCRIEVDPVEFDLLLDPAVRAELVAELARVGYRHVTVDLAGYQSKGIQQDDG